MIVDIDIFAKERTIGKNSKFWSKIKLLEKIEILVKKQDHSNEFFSKNRNI